MSGSRNHPQNDKTTLIRTLALASLAATLAASGCHGKEHRGKEKGKFLVTSPLRRDTDITKEYVCQIHAIRHIEVRALEKGYLQKIYVDEGQTIKKGQRMFQIMPQVYKAEVLKTKAEVQLARIEYKNTKVLADNKVVSPNELALSKAKLNKAIAAMKLAKVHLRFTDIRAPFTGIMDRLRARRGSLLSEGDHLTTLSDTSKMWVYFNVSEADYLNYKASTKHGGMATVKLVMANNKIFPHTGKISTIEGEFNNETGNIAFRATFPNPKALLRHGETGKVLMTVPVKNALLIPQKTTFDILDKKYVYIVDSNNKIRSRLITVAEELPHLFVIAKGLKGGEKILLEGLRKVKEGQEIAVEYKKAAEVFARLELPAE